MIGSLKVGRLSICSARDFVASRLLDRKGRKVITCTSTGSTAKSEDSGGFYVAQQDSEDTDPEPGKIFKLHIDRGEQLKKLGISMYDGTPELSGVILHVFEGGVFQGTPIRKFDRLLGLNGKWATELDKLSEVLETARKLRCLLKRPQAYAFKVRKNKEQSLGLSLGYTPHDEFLVVEDINPGIILELNKQYNDRKVQRFDAVTSVNGVTGAAQDLIRLIEDAEEITFGMLRWYDQDEYIQHFGRDPEPQKQLNNASSSTLR